MDLMFGVAIYFAMMFVSGRAFSLGELGLTVFFLVAPDLDFIPYILLKKKLKLYSHWIIHFPRLYIPPGAIIVGMMGGWFYATCFVLASLAHFLHDSHSIPGIQWNFPPTKTAYRLEGFKMVPVDPFERRKFYEILKNGASKRGLWDEVRIRVGKSRPKWFSKRGG